MDMIVTFLGPVGATFSHEAYASLASLYGAPPPDDQKVEIIPVNRNSEILPTIISYGAYGALAMETKAEGRVAEPLESFIELLKVYESNEVCGFHVIGAVSMKLKFALMAQNNLRRQNVKKIIAHPKALGACRRKIERYATLTEDSTSNGKAAEDVSKLSIHENVAAIAPAAAASKYGLKILDPSFEDSEAVTTFFLIGPKEHELAIADHNRFLGVFNLRHAPGSLVEALQPFKNEGVNLMQIHSMHTGNGSYAFAIEAECSGKQLPRLNRAISTFRARVAKSLVFGPFAVQQA